VVVEPLSPYLAIPNFLPLRVCRIRISRMNQKREPGIIICSFYHLKEVIEQTDAVISILGRSDKLLFPDVGGRPVLRLAFDDIDHTSENFVAPVQDQIAELIEFARRWNGAGILLVHCRAGSSRSPAAAMIAAAALSGPGSAELAVRIRTAKAYFRPNQTMLKLADGLLGTVPGLVDLAQSIPAPTQTDPWGPVRIPLRASDGT
jgi:predicted protein tyrosine phosphatase